MPMHSGGEHTFDRAGFLRVGVAAVAGSALVAVPARGAIPAPTPKGDDISYVQFAASGELVAVSLGQAMLVSPRVSAADKRRLRTLRDGDKDHLARLSAVIGPDDAPHFGDFHIALPAAAERTRDGLLGQALDLGELLAGVYLSGVTDTADAATRGLLGRLLWSEAQHLSVLRTLLGKPALASGLPAPVSLDDAAPLLDAYLADSEPPA
jgi:hypothetical protein